MKIFIINNYNVLRIHALDVKLVYITPPLLKREEGSIAKRGAREFATPQY